MVNADERAKRDVTDLIERYKHPVVSPTGGGAWNEAYQTGWYDDCDVFCDSLDRCRGLKTKQSELQALLDASNGLDDLEENRKSIYRVLVRIQKTLRQRTS